MPKHYPNIVAFRKLQSTSFVIIINSKVNLIRNKVNYAPAKAAMCRCLPTGTACCTPTQHLSSFPSLTSILSPPILSPPVLSPPVAQPPYLWQIGSDALAGPGSNQSSVSWCAGIIDRFSLSSVYGLGMRCTFSPLVNPILNLLLKRLHTAIEHLQLSLEAFRGVLVIAHKVSEDGVDERFGGEEVALGEFFGGKLQHFEADVDYFGPFLALIVVLCIVHRSINQLRFQRRLHQFLSMGRIIVKILLTTVPRIISKSRAPFSSLQLSSAQRSYNNCLQMINGEPQPKGKGGRINSFSVGKAIGKGTFACVRQGRHMPTQCKVAIKILHKRMIQDSRDKMNISREMGIVRKLRHPNIVQLLQLIETNTKIYFIMESVGGGELYERIVNSKIGRLQEQTASRFLQQLLNAVQYLHSLGVAHRDLKPQNILLAQNETIKLIDFGLSNLYSPDQRLTTACGSPCYAAPEMLSQKAYVPLQVDVWSCGIVLYTMLCGYLPFEHESTAELYKLVQGGKYDEPAHLSGEARDLLKRMMRVDPEQRLTIHQIRKHPFCRGCPQPIVKGLLPGEKVLIDADIIEEMKKLGYSGFLRDIEDNATNENTTAFYLLLFRKLAQSNVGIMTYYSRIVETKSPLRSKSFMKAVNPEELPLVSKEHLRSLANLQQLRQASSMHRIGLSEQKLGKVTRPANVRIKKLIK